MLLPIFEWMQASAFTTAVANSWWAGATFNVCHLLALAVFIGATLLVDLRLLGAGLREQPVARLAADARPWLSPVCRSSPCPAPSVPRPERRACTP